MWLYVVRNSGMRTLFLYVVGMRLLLRTTCDSSCCYMWSAIADPLITAVLSLLRIARYAYCCVSSVRILLLYVVRNSGIADPLRGSWSKQHMLMKQAAAYASRKQHMLWLLLARKHMLHARSIRKRILKQAAYAVAPTSKKAYASREKHTQAAAYWSKQHMLATTICVLLLYVCWYYMCTTIYVSPYYYYICVRILQV
jgi:hypothetical protein